VATFEDLVRQLGDRKAFYLSRKDAVQGLVRLGDPAAVPHLAAALSDPEPYVRRGAAQGLAKLGAAAAVEPLGAALAEEKDEYVRRDLVEAVGSLGLEETRPILQALLADASFSVRWAAELALRKLPAPGAAPLEPARALGTPVPEPAAEPVAAPLDSSEWSDSSDRSDPSEQYESFTAAAQAPIAHLIGVLNARIASLEAARLREEAHEGMRRVSEFPEESRVRIRGAEAPGAAPSGTPEDTSAVVGADGLVRAKPGHSAMAAGMLSGMCLCCGGQMYNGQVGKALLMLAAAVIVGIFTRGQGVIYVWAVGIADAVVVARRLNRGEAISVWRFF